MHPPNDEGLGSGQNGDTMLGPLPRLYRSLVIATVLLVGVAGGAWVAYVSALPLAAVVGAAGGAVLALGIAFLMVHDFSHHAGPARVVRRP